LPNYIYIKIIHLSSFDQPNLNRLGFLNDYSRCTILIRWIKQLSEQYQREVYSVVTSITTTTELYGEST